MHWYTLKMLNEKDLKFEGDLIARVEMQERNASITELELYKTSDNYYLGYSSFYRLYRTNIIAKVLHACNLYNHFELVDTTYFYSKSGNDVVNFFGFTDSSKILYRQSKIRWYRFLI